MDKKIRDLSVLVTGGAGFIGSNITETLLENGVKYVRIMDNLKTGKMENIQFLLDKYDNVEFMYGDISILEDSGYFNCGKGNSHKAIKYSTSTFTRYFIKDASEKNCCKSLVFAEYLPSTGLIAFMLVFDICLFLDCKFNKLKSIAIIKIQY